MDEDLINKHKELDNLREDIKMLLADVILQLYKEHETINLTPVEDKVIAYNTLLNQIKLLETKNID